MLLLALFALIAGAATAVTPCVLPVLPVALSAGVTGGRGRPLGVVSGLALSFTFAAVALVYVIAALGLPDGLLRDLAIAVLIAFGATSMIPPLGARVEAMLSRAAPRGGRPPRGAPRAGFLSGLFLGGGLGLLYAPCAGPILAGVITVSAAQGFTAGRLAVALAYGIGSAAALYALLLGGRRLTSRLARRSSRFQVAMGAVMVVVALAMLGNYDTRFETAIAGDLPSFLVDPSHSLETSSAAAAGLAQLRGHPARSSGGLRAADAGLRLPVLGRAPEFVNTEHWFNTPGDRPLSMRALRGHVVLVDFWTYSCINCIRTLPYLNAWYEKYRSKGLLIVGVHTPEFPFERSAGNVAEAIAQNGIRYPVVQDNEYGTWYAYRNEYWPAEYLIDPEGRIRLADFGEGGYRAKQRAIRSLLAEAGAKGLAAPVRVHAQHAAAGERTPESYLGAERAQRFMNGSLERGLHHYHPPPGPLPAERLRYFGAWRIARRSATAVRGARLQLSFKARRVFLVLGSPHRPRQLRLLLDGRPIPGSLAGADVHDGKVTVRASRLYRIVDLPRAGRHVLTVRLAPGVRAYSFTFG